MLKSSIAQPCTVRAGAAASRLAAPVVKRGSVIRRFKEDDKVEQAKDNVQKVAQSASDKASSLQNDVKQSASGFKGIIEAADQAPRYTSIKVPFWIPAFTRRREVFVGRIAQIGILAAAALEILTPEHFGPVQQVRLATGLAAPQIVSIITGIVLYNIVGAVGPWSPTYSEENVKDVAKRPEGPPNKLVSPFDVKNFLGISGWGWTKRNELFNGRLAMLGFWAAFNNELATGKGPLGQVATAFNVVPDDSFYATAAKGGLAFFGLMIVLSFVLGSREQGNSTAEDNIY